MAWEHSVAQHLMSRADRGHAIWSQYQDERNNQLCSIWESEMVFPDCQGNLDFFPHQTEAMPICTVSNVLIKQISIEWALKTIRGFSKWVSWLKKWPWEETYHKMFFTCSSVYRDLHNYPEGEKRISPIQKNNPKRLSVDFQQKPYRWWESGMI